MNTYKFVQNNSGGYYVGPAEFVVRAESVDGAWAELKKQEWFTTDFCECCGERWYDPKLLEPIKETSMTYEQLQKKEMLLENDLHWCQGDLAVSVKECGRLEKLLDEHDYTIREMKVKIDYLTEQLNRAKIVEEVLRGLIKG